MKKLVIAANPFQQVLIAPRKRRGDGDKWQFLLKFNLGDDRKYNNSIGLESKFVSQKSATKFQQFQCILTSNTWKTAVLIKSLHESFMLPISIFMSPLHFLCGSL